MTNDTERQPLSIKDLGRIVYDRHCRVNFPFLDVAAPTRLLEEAMRFIEKHPERHNQAVWMEWIEGLDTSADDAPICGTAGCLAGWGITLNSPIEGQQISPGTGRVVLADQRRYAFIDEYAAHLFGLTQGQASMLFESGWTTWQLRAGVDAIKANPGIGRDALYRVMRSTWND